MLLFISACTGSDILEQTTAISTPTNTASMVANPVDPVNTDTSDGGLTDLADTVPTRIPEPTATPGPLAREVSEFVDEIELTEDVLFRFSVEDCINLGISILFVLGGSLIGKWVIRWLLPKIVLKTATTLDDRLPKVLVSIQRQKHE